MCPVLRYNREIQSRDVLMVNDLFCSSPADLYLYNKLLHELAESGKAKDPFSFLLRIRAQT